MTVVRMILLKKRGTGDVRSPLNLVGHSNTYARKDYKAQGLRQINLNQFAKVRGAALHFSGNRI